MVVSDVTANQFNIGDTVNVPIVITAIGGTTANPTVTGTTKYAGFNAATDVVGPLDAVQVVVNK